MTARCALRPCFPLFPGFALAGVLPPCAALDDRSGFRAFAGVVFPDAPVKVPLVRTAAARRTVAAPGTKGSAK